MLEALAQRFTSILPKASDCSYCAARFVEERSERVAVRQDVVQPLAIDVDVGAMITVMHDGGYGYAATSDLSESGLRAAVERARSWAARTAPRAISYGDVALPHPQGEYRSPVGKRWDALSLEAKISLLSDYSKRLKRHADIVDWEASLWRVLVTTLFVTNSGGRVTQERDFIAPRMSVTANRGTETQTRSMGMFDRSQQGGLEVLDRARLQQLSEVLPEEVMQLIGAPNCPSGPRDLVLMPDQMMLQIHESIGHPLELDRILGDERNYAGTSFVTLDMFGQYQYGSPLLDVTFDPSRGEQLASYRFDDDGVPAEKVHVIRRGKLERPLGSAFSQARAKIAGTANARATSWNRPPIDRMANLNVEPRDKSFDDIIGSVEKGILMTTNCSWSIDDSRNKFQFGCEKGQLIENGKLGAVVKNPNYRGVSATFWRSLSAVGDRSTMEVLGTPFCGKGEPNQVVHVGHASPVCRFDGIDVFGGE
ncbi:MAG: TldD/PmbA family protein [Polyangiaceae bacterium]